MEQLDKNMILILIIPVVFIYWAFINIWKNNINWWLDRNFGTKHDRFGRGYWFGVIKGLALGLIIYLLSV